MRWRPSCERHEGNVPEFVVNATGTFHDDETLREVSEPVLMNKIEEGQLINFKVNGTTSAPQGLL